MEKKSIVLLIAHEGYQQTEYGVTREILASDGINVITASDEVGVARAKDCSTTTVDITIDQIKPMHIDGLFLIGGPCALEYLDTHHVHNLLQEMMTLDKPYGAICVSPRILAKAGVLRGKNATGWDEDNALEVIFKKHGVTYVHEPVVVDDKVVTAEGPDAAQSFALGIVKVLGN